MKVISLFSFDKKGFSSLKHLFSYILRVGRLITDFQKTAVVKKQIYST